VSAALADLEPAPTPRRSGRRRPQEPVEVDGELEDVGELVDAGAPVGGATRGWRPHRDTEARARELGIDLLRWPLQPPALGWEQAAACRDVSSSVADQLSECLSQAAATELVGSFCSVCPVRTQCFETGRTTGGFGIWGGISLREGRVATWRTVAERSRRSTAEITEPIDDTSPAEITAATEDTATTYTPPERRRGQRPQPRRLSRARRRGRHAPAA